MGKCVKSRPMYRVRGQGAGYGKQMHTTGLVNEYWNSVALGVGPRLKSLYDNVGEKIEGYLELFTLGNMSELNDIYTYEVFKDLVQKFGNEKGEFPDEYTKFLGLIMSVNGGLYRATIQYAEYANTIKQLKNQIEQLKNPTSALMQVSATMNTVATIREEIAIYIKLYGLPPGLVFDAEKLGPIMSELSSAAN